MNLPLSAPSLSTAPSHFATICVQRSIELASQLTPSAMG